MINNHADLWTIKTISKVHDNKRGEHNEQNKNDVGLLWLNVAGQWWLGTQKQ